MEYQRDEDGNVLNPPSDPDFERRLADAHNRADQRAINRITDEYHQWRDERVKDDEANDDDRAPAQNITANRGSDGATEPTPEVVDVPTHDAAVADNPDDAEAVRQSSEQGV